MGYDEAYYTIGEMYEYGELGAIDFVTARHYYEKAAMTGNPNAQVSYIFIPFIFSLQTLRQLWVLSIAQVKM